ncbi:MAG: DUF1572 family protein [Acidobacteriaceae bacterium]|nr:DUF1572 family protein [Acidobacteriaceae bacterium]
MADANALAAAFTEYAIWSLNRSEVQIGHCLGRLSEEQMQQRGGDHENSIVNLLLHLDGNIRQWVLHGVAGQEDVRQREQEFDLSPKLSGREAFSQLQGTLAACREAFAAVSADRLLEIIDPQPSGSYRFPTVMAASARAFGHLEYHTGQIILLTKQIAATDLDLTIPRKR